MFAADLIRALHRAGLAPQVEFIHLSSYRAGTRLLRPGRDPARRRERRARPRRAARRRHPRIGPHRRLRQGPFDGARRKARAHRRAAREAGQARRRRSTPISSASPAPTCSSSATAWMWPIPSANCPSSASSTTSTPSPTCSAAPDRWRASSSSTTKRPSAASSSAGSRSTATRSRRRSTAATALDRLTSAAGAFDLLLTDIRMPIMDGIALALAAKRDYPELTILLMTGFADQRERATRPRVASSPTC